MTINQIIGNKEKKSNIDTELWKKMNEKYSGIENKTEKENKTEEITPKIPVENFKEKKLTYDPITGNPVLVLNPLKNTTVNTKTQKEYDTLMQIYMAGGWHWENYIPSNFDNKWTKYERETNIGATKSFKNYSNYKIIFHNLKKISIEEFYKEQSITQKIISELNEWYDKNYPNRVIKG